MKPLPHNYKCLQKISKLLNDYLKSPGTSVEIRSVELYELVTKDPELRMVYPTQKVFNQFLRRQHQEGVLRSFITYRVDESNYEFYQWYFRANEAREESDCVATETKEGTSAFFRYSKRILASDATKLRSNQEKFIYEQLRKSSNLIIVTESPVTIDGKSKYVDFIILNKVTGKSFYWEHFGMINSEDYKDGMTDKIGWYKKNGFKTVEDGGNLIYTYYSTENSFHKEVLKYISIIES